MIGILNKWQNLPWVRSFLQTGNLDTTCIARYLIALICCWREIEARFAQLNYYNTNNNGFSFFLAQQESVSRSITFFGLHLVRFFAQTEFLNDSILYGRKHECARSSSIFAIIFGFSPNQSRDIQKVLQTRLFRCVNVYI